MCIVNGKPIPFVQIRAKLEGNLNPISGRPMTVRLRQTPLLLTLILALHGCDRPSSPTQVTEVASIGLNAARLDNTSRYAVTGSIHHGISLWRVADQERLFDWTHTKDSPTTMIAADFSPDAAWVLTADTHTLALWKTDTGENHRYWNAPAQILAVQLSGNGRKALLGLDDHTAVLFDLINGGILQTLRHNNRVRSVALNADASIALTGSEDYQAISWDLHSGKPLAQFQHSDDVQLVALSADATLALSVSKYDKAVIWDTRTGEPVGQLPLAAEGLKRGLRFTSARFSADNRLLLTGRPDQRVTLWDIATLKALTEWELPKRSRWKPTGASIVDVAFTDESDTFYAIGSNGFLARLEYPSREAGTGR